jgi:hypothetical protein
MNQHEEDYVRQTLQDVFPRVNTDLRRDLWPAMMRKVEVQRPKIAWYDWGLAGLVAGVVAVFPDLILVLVYHL